MGGLQIFYPVNPPRGVYRSVNPPRGVYSGGFTADNIAGPYGICMPYIMQSKKIDAFYKFSNNKLSAV